MHDPVVFLPGLMCDARLFSNQIGALSSKTAVMVAPLTEGERVEDIARNLLSHLPPRFALAGLSFGGIVAMEILRQGPDRVTRLALMDTNPLAETPQVAAMREPQMIKARMGRLREVMAEEMKPKYLAPGPDRVEILNLVLQMAESLGPDVFVRQSRALQRRPDQQATLRQCKVPTMVMCGAHDALCPPKRHEFMAELIPFAKLRVFSRSGHLPTLEQPEAASEALADWLTMPLPLKSQ